MSPDVHSGPLATCSLARESRAGRSHQRANKALVGGGRRTWVGLMPDAWPVARLARGGYRELPVVEAVQGR